MSTVATPDHKATPIHPIDRLLRADHGALHHGTVHVDHDGAVGLTRDLARLQDNFMIAVLKLFSDWSHLRILKPWIVES